MYEDYYEKVCLVCKAKYEINEDVVKTYEEIISIGYTSNFSPIRTMEWIARDLFG